MNAHLARLGLVAVVDEDLPLPCYRLYVYDGAQSTDSDGMQLPDLNAAEAEAQRFAGEATRDRAGRTDRGTMWRLEVADEANLTLFRIDVVMSRTSNVLAME